MGDVHQQMTADRARRIAYHACRYGVARCSMADFEELRDALKTPELFAAPGTEAGDPWEVDPDETDLVEVAEPRPAKPLLPSLSGEVLEELRRDAAGDVDERLPTPIDHVHETLGPVLEALHEGHALLVPLLKADDARSRFLCTMRWAHALAFHWGVDGEGYHRAVEAALALVSR